MRNAGTARSERAYPYIYVDGIYLKRSWGRTCEKIAVAVAIDVNNDGYREYTVVSECFTESSECWRELISWLQYRKLRVVMSSTVLARPRSW